MARRKNEHTKAVKQKDVVEANNFSPKTRRSSMRVNLSYVSNPSDLEHSSLNTSDFQNNEILSENSLSQNDVLNTVKLCKTKKLPVNDNIKSHSSVININNISSGTSFVNKSKGLKKIQSNLLMDINEKEKQLNKSCMQLKDAIMNKTKALFDKQNELAIKTSEVLAIKTTSPTNETILTDKRSPSVRVNIGKNDQIIMSGDGRKRNPVQVNSMFNSHSMDKEFNVSKPIEEDCYQNIVSTPKKSRIERYKSRTEFHGNISPTILKIPVARLFNDANNLNNSLSEINPLPRINSSNDLEKIIPNTNKISKSKLNDTNRISNESNGMSPILSQGIRKSLSLKKKLRKNLSQTSTRLSSSSITNEKFCKSKMFTCSSFINKQDNTDVKNKINGICRTTDPDEKNKVNNCNTIDLIDSKNYDKTVNISSNTNSSCMELTAISSHFPIIRRSFQRIIHNSLILENMVNECSERVQNYKLLHDQIPSITTKNLNKQVSNLVPTEKTKNNNVCQNTSLNVNTSLDEINLVDHITQKENKTPNSVEIQITKNNKSQIEEDNMIIQQQNINSTSQVSSSLDLIKKSLVTNIINKEPAKSDKITCLKSNSINGNQEKQKNDKIILRQPSTSTIRSSLQVNTSLDSVRKSPIIKTVLDFNKICSTVVETSSNNDQSKSSKNNSKDQSFDIDSELENVSLMERIKNFSKTKRANKQKLNEVKNTKKKSTKDQNTSLNIIRKSTEIMNLNSNATNKFIENKDTSSSSSSTSIIEGTPYATSRSTLYKTIIKNNIASSTLGPQRLIETLLDNEDSNNKLQTIIHKKPVSPKKNENICIKKKILNYYSSDTIAANSSDESSNESDKKKELVIINESLNELKTCNEIESNTKFENKKKNKKITGKRKLYPSHNSQLISFTPTKIEENTKKREFPGAEKRNKTIRQKKKQQNKLTKKTEDPSINESCSLENETLPKKIEKVKKKPKKILSKKIVVKKVMNMTALENMIYNHQQRVPSQRLSERNSLREFDIKGMESKRKIGCRKNHKTIVITGVTKGEKDVVKSVIKSLGSASLEPNVTLRTTHVISSGIRTINLLKGILRGCWLLSLEWALKSLENESWLDPSPYEMFHFSKAVQENRRDRQLFGKAYVPELFVTCGIIYVENGTSPPPSTLKDLIKIAGGRITEDPSRADIIIGSEGLREIWILDSITTGEVQCPDQYKRN